MRKKGEGRELTIIEGSKPCQIVGSMSQGRGRKRDIGNTGCKVSQGLGVMIAKGMMLKMTTVMGESRPFHHYSAYPCSAD